MTVGATAFLRVYMRFEGRLFAPTTADIRLAVVVDRLCTTHGVTHERLMAHWRQRARDFYPTTFPTLEILATPGAVLDACAPVSAVPSTEAPYNQSAPRMLAGWSTTDLETARRVANAWSQGHRVFVTDRLFALVLRLSIGTLAPKVRPGIASA